MRGLRFACTAALAAVSLVSCGEDQEPASGPASFAPAATPLYLEVSRESEEQVANAEDLIAELGEVPLLGSTIDPRDLTEQAIDDSAADEGLDITFAEDIEPWLGDRAGIAFMSLAQLVSPTAAGEADVVAESGDPDFVAILEASDEAIASDSIDRILTADESVAIEEEEVGGETVKRPAGSEGGVAVFDGSVVFGSTDAALEQAFAARDGDSLGEADEFVEALDGLPAERLGAAYLDFGAFVDLTAAQLDQGELEAMSSLYGDALSQPFVFALTAGESSLAVDASAGAFPFSFPAASPSELLPGAPADSIAAIGLDDVGMQLRDLFDVVVGVASQFAPAEVDPATFGDQLEAQIGVTVEEATEAFGDGVAYLRGDLPDVFAISLEVDLPGGSEAPLRISDSASQQLRGGGYDVGPPLERGAAGFSTDLAAGEIGFLNVEIADGSVEMVIAPSRAAVEGLDEEPGALGDHERYTRAEESVGDEFEVIGVVDPQPIIDALLGSSSVSDVITGEAAPEQLIAKFVADKLAVIGLGVREADDRLISRVVLAID